MPRILDKYMAREFIWPFVGCVAGFTIMLVSGTVFELMEFVISDRMAVSVVLELLLHTLPRIVVTILPIAALFATLLSLGRLVRDSEMGAIRSAGVSFRRSVVALLIASVAVSWGAFLLNEHVVPQSEHKAQTILRENLYKDHMPNVEYNVFFRGDDRFFYVNEVDTAKSELRHVLVYATQGSEEPGIISAERGTFDDTAWYLQDGVSRTFNERGQIDTEVRWDSLTYDVPASDTPFFVERKTPGEMTRRELNDHLTVLQRSGIDVKDLLVEYHMKLAMPLASFIWVFLGAPLSLRSVRHARVFGVAVAILVTFAYFVVSAFFRSLGHNGALPPLLAAWMTNGLFFALGLWLTVRADRV